MRILVADKGNILHKGDAEVVIILLPWGYRVVKAGGANDYCTDLEKLLSDPNISTTHLKAVRAWAEKAREDRV